MQTTRSYADLEQRIPHLKLSLSEKKTTSSDEKINHIRCWWIHLLTLPISTHVLQGICKVTGYEVLSHGTGTCYFSILKNGAQPSYGGTASNFKEGMEFAVKESKNKFFVFKDSKINVDLKILPSCLHFIENFFVHKCFIAAHSGFAYISEYRLKNHIPLSARLSKLIILRMVAYAIFSPRIRFVYTLKEIHGEKNVQGIFKNDKDYGQTAYCTTQILPNHRIGLVGFVNHFSWKHAFTYICNNPTRVMVGITELSIGIFLTMTGLGTLF